MNTDPSKYEIWKLTNGLKGDKLRAARLLLMAVNQFGDRAPLVIELAGEAAKASKLVNQSKAKSSITVKLSASRKGKA